MAQGTRRHRANLRAVAASLIAGAAICSLLFAPAASAYPHLDAGRTYRADIPRGGTDGTAATLFIYTDAGPRFGTSAHFALHCPGLTPTVPPFPITQRRAMRGSAWPYDDVFSYVSPYPQLGYVDFFGKVVRARNPIPRLTLTVSGITGCADQSNRRVRRWKELPATRDDSVVREILQGFRLSSRLLEGCPSQSYIGAPVTIPGELSPDAGGTPVTVTERSSLEAAATTATVSTQGDGGFAYSFTPQPDDIHVLDPYTQTVTMAFAGDLTRTPASTSCSWSVVRP